MAENFIPVSNTPPDSFSGKLKFYGRMLLDLQILTIYSDIKKELPKFEGMVLDIGCGQSPYKHLLNKTKTVYKGIDVAEATSFGYHNEDITIFDGEIIPFSDDTFDALICTEVFEHVYNFQKLADEMYRVCKKDAKAIVTIPFSARYHYIPYDYFRYTPSALVKIFSKFTKVEIKSRGTDILSICAKIIVLFSRNLIANTILKVLLLPFWLLMLPILVITVIVAHISRILNLGSDLDPLGYTILFSK